MFDAALRIGDPTPYEIYIYGVSRFSAYCYGNIIWLLSVSAWVLVLDCPAVIACDSVRHESAA